MAKSEQPAIYVMRHGNALVPEMSTDAELISRLPVGERIKVMLHTGRSPAKLRWYWTFLGRIVKATECAPSPEALHDVIKLHTGFVTPVMVKGFTVAVPKSVSFSSMSEEEFNDFLTAAEKWIAQTYGVTAKNVFPEENRRTAA